MTPSEVARDIIQEFKNRYSEFFRKISSRNKVRNPRRPPKWSDATIATRNAHREANKDKIKAREAERVV